MNKRLFGPRSRPGTPGSGDTAGAGEDMRDAGPAAWPARPGMPLEPGSEAARQVARAELARCMSNPELRRMIARMRLPAGPEAASEGRDDPSVPPPAAPALPPEATAPPVQDSELAPAAPGSQVTIPVSDAEPAAAMPAARHVPARRAGPEPFSVMAAAFRRVPPPARPVADRAPDAEAEPPEGAAATGIVTEPQPAPTRRRGRARAQRREHGRDRPRLSRSSRIAVGLTPVYLGLLVFAYDALFGPYQPAREAGEPAMAVARHAGSAEPATVGGYALAIDTGRSLPDVAEIASPAAAGLSRGSASAPPAAGIDARIGLAAAPETVMAAVEEAGARPTDADAAATMTATALPATTDAGQAEGGVFAQQAGTTAEGAGPVLAALDPAAAEALTLDPVEAEEALALDRTTRREIQRRLTLAGFSAGGVDGIFGDRTRAAITEWQQGRGVPGTGYLDAAQLAMLKDETAEDYRRYRSTHPREPQAQSRPVRARSAATGRYIDGHGCLREADGSAVPYFRAGCG